jgi:hypothetical protein
LKNKVASEKNATEDKKEKDKLKAKVRLHIIEQEKALIEE